MNDKKASSGKALKIVATLFAALLITLIFLSKTIYTFNLPQVTGVMPVRGKLNKIEFSTGVTSYEEETELYSNITGKIEAVLFREGDAVQKGTPIFEISFNGEDDDIRKQIAALKQEHEKRLEELYIVRDKLNLDIERINSGIGNANRKMDEFRADIYRKMDELKAEVYIADEVSDDGITQCEKDIDAAREDLENLRLLFEVGAVAKSEVDVSERDLQRLLGKLENLIKTKEDNIRKNAEAIAEKETNRQKKLEDYKYQLETYTRDYEYQLETYAQDLTAKQLDIDTNVFQEKVYIQDYAVKLADYNEELELYDESRIITAPEDAVITQIHLNKGQIITPGTKLISFGLATGYIVECKISLDNNFVTSGDVCKLSNAERSIKGTVTKITPGDGSKTVTLLLDDENVTSGETFTITFEKQSGESYILVPNGAVGQDGEGYYLNEIKRREGILGEEYYTQKLRIYIGDSDAASTAVIRGITFSEPVVLIADKPFAEGETIKIRNAGDFFVD
jgi:multidrug efflux pump subunit AcrA (membrane-fusion protein)